MSGSSGDPRNKSSFFPRFTFLGLLRWIKLRVTGMQVIVGGECIKCGVCCGDLNLSRKSHWIRSKAEFEKLAADLPEYKRFKHIGYTISGLMKFDCDCLSKEGYCTDYENRPDFCEAYPEPDLYFMGGEIPPYCGFEFRIVPSFRRMLNREMKNPQDKTEEPPPPPKEQQG